MQRWIPLREELSPLLKAWIEVGRVQLKKHPVKRRASSSDASISIHESESLFLSAAGKPYVLGDFTDRIQRLSDLVCGRRLSPRMFRKLRATYFSKSVESGEIASCPAERERLLEKYARFEGHTAETLKRDYVLRADPTEEFQDILEVANRHLLPPELRRMPNLDSSLPSSLPKKRRRKSKQGQVVDSDDELPESVSKTGRSDAGERDVMDSLDDLPDEAFTFDINDAPAP